MADELEIEISPQMVEAGLDVLLDRPLAYNEATVRAILAAALAVRPLRVLHHHKIAYGAEPWPST